MRARPGLRHATCVAIGILCACALLLARAPRRTLARTQAATWFARPTGSGTTCTQGEPCSLVQALTKAANGDTIYLAGGTYTGSGAAVIQLSKDLILRGGWDGTTASGPVRDPFIWITTLDGQNLRRVVLVTAGKTVTLDGLEVANGTRSDEGAGLYAYLADVTLQTVTVRNNTVRSIGTGTALGAGAYMSNGAMRIVDSDFYRNSIVCTTCSVASGGGLYAAWMGSATVDKSSFYENDASLGSGLTYQDTSQPIVVRESSFYHNGRGDNPDSFGLAGGGMAVLDAAATLEGCSFTSNRGINAGGALSAEGGSVTMERCTVSGNIGLAGSGIRLWGIDPFQLTNNVIVDNVAPDAGASSNIVLVNSRGYAFHNTIVRNTSAYAGPGVELFMGSIATLRNTILARHTVGVAVEVGSSANLDGTLWGGGAWANTTRATGLSPIEWGAINVEGDPAFVDPDNLNFHIGPASAAIDAGCASHILTDIDLDPRPLGAGVDIGADEYAGPASPSPTPTPTVPGPTFTLTATPTTTPGPTHTPTPTVPLTGLQIFFSDLWLTDGSLYRYDPAGGQETVVYSRLSFPLWAFSVQRYPGELYMLGDSSNRAIYRVVNTAGVWGPEEVLYTHTDCISDLQTRTESDGSLGLYFSVSYGAGANGMIYRLVGGVPTPYYEVRLQDVERWAGNFCFGPDGELYLSQGNVHNASIYRVRGGSVEKVYGGGGDRNVVGMCYVPPGGLYFADQSHGIWRLDLATRAVSLVYSNGAHTQIGNVGVIGSEPVTTTATPTLPAQPTLTRTPTLTLSAQPTPTCTAMPTPTRTSTPITPGPTRTPTLQPTGLQVYFSDYLEAPGSLFRYDPVTRQETTVYTRPGWTLQAFHVQRLPSELYFTETGGTSIFRVVNTAGVWGLQELVYRHSDYVSDLQTRTESDGSLGLYFSTSFGSGGNGMIYRIVGSSPTLYYEVRLQDVGGSWTGNFCFDRDGNLYLAQGNSSYAKIFHVVGNRVEMLYRAGQHDSIMGLCFVPPGAIYYADWQSSVWRLDLATRERSLIFTNPAHTRLAHVSVIGSEPIPPWRVRLFLPVVLRR